MIGENEPPGGGAGWNHRYVQQFTRRKPPPVMRQAGRSVRAVSDLLRFGRGMERELTIVPVALPRYDLARSQTGTRASSAPFPLSENANMADDTATPAPRRRAMGMHRRANTPRLTAEQASRQGDITNLALKSLGSGAAIAFLNTAHDGIGGRPLDVAIASADGYARVVKAVARAAEDRLPVG
jgi:hypothetical protein